MVKVVFDLGCKIVILIFLVKEFYKVEKVY